MTVAGTDGPGPLQTVIDGAPGERLFDATGGTFALKRVVLDTSHLGLRPGGAILSSGDRLQLSQVEIGGAGAGTGGGVYSSADIYLQHAGYVE